MYDEVKKIVLMIISHNITVFCNREIFMEKHWKSVIKRSICDYFFEAQKKVNKSIVR